MKSLLIVGTCLLFSSILTAQEPAANFGDTYFFLGLTLPITKVRDQAHSPQLYQGWTPTVSLGYQSVGKEGVTRSSFSYIFSPMSLSPKARPKPERQLSSANVNTFQFSTAIYKRVGNYSTEGWNRYVGGAVTFTFDTRVYNLPSNNIFGYQCNTSLNAGLFVQKKLDDKWRFNYETFTPLLSYSLRPNHIGMPPLTTGDFSNGTKRFLKSGKVVTINKLFRFYNRFAFERTVNDHRQRQFSYTWDAVVNKVAQPTTSITGGLGTTSLFKM